VKRARGLACERWWLRWQWEGVPWVGRRARVLPISCWQCAASLALALFRLWAPLTALLSCPLWD